MRVNKDEVLDRQRQSVNRSEGDKCVCRIWYILLLTPHRCKILNIMFIGSAIPIGSCLDGKLILLLVIYWIVSCISKPYMKGSEQKLNWFWMKRRYSYGIKYDQSKMIENSVNKLNNIFVCTTYENKWNVSLHRFSMRFQSFLEPFKHEFVVRLCVLCSHPYTNAYWVRVRICEIRDTEFIC